MRSWMLATWMLCGIACAGKGTVPPEVAGPSAREFARDGVVLAVMVPFEATELPDELEGLGRGFSDLVAVQLREIGIDAPGFEEMAEVAIAGQLVVLRDTLRIDARVARMPPAEPEVVGVASATGRVKDFPEHLRTVVQELAQVFGLEVPAEPAPTTSVDALVALGRALGAIERGEDDAADKHLDDALAADPAFERAKELKDLLSPR